MTEALRTWGRVAMLSFGGPAGQIAMMHRILVEEKRWVSEERFLHALNYCMLLPGPEAQQLATYIGWLMHRTLGGIIAGALFVLPGFLSILALSILYAGFQETTFVQAIFFGLKPAVMAVVVQAVIRIGGRALKTNMMLALAAMAFVGIFFLQIPFPLIVVGAGAIGLLGGHLRPTLFTDVRAGHTVPAGESAGAPSLTDDGPASQRPSSMITLAKAILWVAIWLVPVLGLVLLLGRDHVFVAEALFFSKAAVVTFGGAYAVLAYIAQQAVETYQWLLPGEMLDGLGMAETTPGPLIQVVQFVGFMGAYRDAGGMDPMLSGVIGSVITTWVVFIPSFLFIFVGAPYIEYLRGNKALSNALSAITAAVVGVILNLALWFSLHVLFAEVDEVQRFGMRLLLPAWPTVDVASLVLALGAFVAMFRFKVGMIPTLGGAALLGALYYAFG